MSGLDSQAALDPDEDLRRLLGVRARAHAEVDVGIGQVEVAEDRLRQPGVVVLAGVDERLLHAVRLERRQHGGGFHEVGPRAYDVEQVHLMVQDPKVATGFSKNDGVSGFSRTKEF